MSIRKSLLLNPGLKRGFGCPPSSLAPVSRKSDQLTLADKGLLVELVRAGALSKEEAKQVKSSDEICFYARQVYGHP